MRNFDEQKLKSFLRVKMEKKEIKTENDWIEKIIKNLLIKNFYTKFIKLGKHKIYLHNIYNFVRDKMQLTWIKKKPFLSKVKKIYRTYLNRYYYYKNNKKLQEIQKKYTKLQITEAFFYLSLKEKVKLKEEDLKLFDEVLEIIFAPIMKKK